MGQMIDIDRHIDHESDKGTVRNLQKRGLHCAI